MTKLFLIAFTILTLSLPAVAQDKPQPKAASKLVAAETKPLPATATIAAADVNKLEDINRVARLAQLEAENLELKIANAQSELTKLKDAAKKAGESASNAYFAMLEKAGIPRDKATEYEVKQEADKSLKLTRRERKKD